MKCDKVERVPGFGRRTLGWLAGAGLVLGLMAPGSAEACTACYGQSDSPMAVGMNWGILSLLTIIVGVLMGVAGFFVYLARRAAAAAPPSAPSGPELASANTASNPT